MGGEFEGSLRDMKMPTPLESITYERARQDDKWGVQNHHPYTWLAILGEEYGEACNALLGGSLLNLRQELIETAAVAVAMIECLDRGEWKA